MAEEQSSLQQAMSRIMGAPAGGTDQNAVQLAAQTPYSALPTGTPATSLNISNTEFDPYAEQNARLAAMQAETAALQSQLTGGTAAAGGTAAPRNSAGLTQAEFEAALGKSMAATPTTIREPGKFMAGAVAGQFSTPENWNKYHSLYGFTGDTLNRATEASMRMGAGSTMRQTSGTSTPYSLSVVPAGGTGASAGATGAVTAVKPALRKPVNPGPRAPWQQSAQYWRDLETYKKAGGT